MGVDVEELTSLEESVLRKKIFDQKNIRFLELSIIVRAVFDAAAGNGSQGIDGQINKLRGLLFPEIAENLVEKAKKTKKILEHEHTQGAFKVESLEYSRKGKRKRG